MHYSFMLVMVCLPSAMESSLPTGVGGDLPPKLHSSRLLPRIQSHKQVLWQHILRKKLKGCMKGVPSGFSCSQDHMLLYSGFSVHISYFAPSSAILSLTLKANFLYSCVDIAKNDSQNQFKSDFNSPPSNNVSLQITSSLLYH